MTAIQSALLERAAEDGQPLNPELPGDAATLLRAEVLVREGADGSQALAQARDEHVVMCEVCREPKPTFQRADAPGLAWPACGHQAIHVDDEQTVSLDHFLGKEGT